MHGKFFNPLTNHAERDFWRLPTEKSECCSTIPPQGCLPVIEGTLRSRTWRFLGRGDRAKAWNEDDVVSAGNSSQLRFATRWGQYQYINPYEGFNEETRNGFLPKTSRITATLLGGRNYRRRRIFSALPGVCSTKFSISALGIREIFSKIKILPNAKLIFPSIKEILH